jgi:hypothetical protein
MTDLSTLTVPFEVEIRRAWSRTPVGDNDTPEIRVVDVPADKIPPNRAATPELFEEICDLVFHYGQNDFQPKPIESVSVGDVIRLGEGRFRVDSIGFTRIS